MEGLLLWLTVCADTFIGEADDGAGIEIRQLAQAASERLVVELDGFLEDLVVGLEGHARSAALISSGEFLNDVERFDDESAFKADEVHLAAARDFDVHPFGERVDAGDTYTVESA